jgi:predicted nucleotidyltransferase
MFEQDRVLVRLQQRVMSEADVMACFLAGSYGRRQNDPYSDLDVALVFADEAARDRAWRQRRAFVQSVMQYVPAKSFDAVQVRPYFHIALYSNGTKADYRYELQSELQPSPWDRDIHILKDTNGWAERHQAACARTLLPRPWITATELAALNERFWIMLWDAFRLLLRGDGDKPFTIYLELLYFTLPPLLDVLPPEDPARLPLLRAQFNQDTMATAVHLHNLLQAYLEGRTAIIQRLHLDFSPDTRFETAVQNLIKSKLSP